MLNVLFFSFNKNDFLFAFICVMHMDVRMPRAQERRICGLFFELCHETNHH